MLFEIVVKTSLVLIAIANISLILIATSAFNTLTNEDEKTPIKKITPDVYTKSEANEIFDTNADKSDTYTKTETDTLLDAKTDKTELIDAYTKTETDTPLDAKTDKTDIIEAYTKTETDEKLDFKANVVDVVDSYSKTETDILLEAKVDKTDTYTKIETDSLLDDKADQTDLANYVDLTSAQTISGGGDMLVNSLVTQPQLQEVRDIATGKSKAYVFSIQEELNDWMVIQDNVAKQVIGDNLYIVDKEVTDYWWEGTDLKILQTGLSDMINVITTLGAATRNGNGKTDISIDGNTLISAKNTTFVITGNDQSITGMETFTYTIIFNGIQYTGYDNNSVFLAGGGDRSSEDIYSASYSKSEDDALLLLKADKAQFIDSYIKTQTNNLFNNKASQSTTYSKLETDQLISLIDKGNVDLSSYYTKIKTHELLDQKADTTDLANYVTLGTAQTITANNTFNNSRRFVSSIVGISTVTGSSFIKSGADNTAVLHGAGGTKPISEFVRRLKYIRPFGGTYDETQDPVANTYLTIGIEDLTSTAFSVQEDTVVATYIPFPSSIIDKGGYSDHITKKFKQLCCIFLKNEMSQVYLDEALLDVAGHSDFPELYAYIRERYEEPIPSVQQIPI
ncbi:MAG: hypothetical protein EZS28_017751 [Streblomastix strix]|uniref:Uncharacterized protein n=1 Tax=Streblomastix strix TaxID=222440 RepID=A0A5J4VVI5_9EUKA|nr:MAG: hypothetical protein EZS28_017751 [Streblomastix strix]